MVSSIAPVSSPQGYCCTRRSLGVEVGGEEIRQGPSKLRFPRERVLMGPMFFVIMPGCARPAHARSYNLVFSKYLLFKDYDMAEDPR